MPWTKASKIKFFQERRKASIKKHKDLGYTGKQAVKMGTKLASKQYQAYKKGFSKVDKLTVRIDILIAKDDKTKAEKRELNRIEKQRAKIARTTHEKWNKFQESIGYKEPSEADIETVRKGT